MAKKSGEGVKLSGTDGMMKAIGRKKGELVRLLYKKQLNDGEVIKKSCELDNLLVEYMRAK